MRSALPVCLLLGLAAGPVFAQGTVTRAATPEAAALDRLGLKADWSTFVPVQHRKDGLARVQAVGTTQIFVQTKGGLMVVLDAGTGREQWKFQFPSSNTEQFNVGFNYKYVFSVNVSKLYCHDRFTGTLEFEMELPEAPSVGPVCDGDRFYVVFSSGRMACYDLPPMFRETTAAVEAMKNSLRRQGVLLSEDVEREREMKEKRDRGELGDRYSLADGVADRNAGRQFSALPSQPEFERFNVPQAYFASGFGINNNQATYSVAALQQVTPPYYTGGLNKVVSVAMLPSVKQPYTSRPDYLTYNQLTPSVVMMPPSVARLFELTNLRPPPYKPTRLWVTEVGGMVYADPVTGLGEKAADFRFAEEKEVQSKMASGYSFIKFNTANGPVYEGLWYGQYQGLRVGHSGEVWVTSDSKTLRKFYSRVDEYTSSDGAAEGRVALSTVPAAGQSGPLWYGDIQYQFVPLADGQVKAVVVGAADKLIRDGRLPVGFNTNVGGLLNRKPIGATDGVYVGGDRSGTARINVNTGDVDWRTDPEVDRILAVGDAFVFARDRRGNVLVYSKGKADPNTLLARPLGTLAAEAFDVTVSNDTTDRVLLAANNGLVVSLRESNAKAGKPKLIAPPLPSKPSGGEAKPADPNAPMPPEKKPDEKPPEEKK